MNYYNEIYFTLFGFMFVMLAVSTTPFYRKDAIEKPSWLLAGVPLMGAVSYFLFLLAPLTHMGLLIPANLFLIASVFSSGLLQRHWRGVDSKLIGRALLALLFITGLVFLYLFEHGSYQQRVSLLMIWVVGSCIWNVIEAYRLYKIKKSFYVLALMVVPAIWIVLNLVRWMSGLLSVNSSVLLYEEPDFLLVYRFVLGAVQIVGQIFLITHASERLTWRSQAIQKEKIETGIVNEELTRLVAERDHMLMINSRFSTVSKLAMFNSAIVHELSQPLTALTLTLEHAQLRMKNTDESLQASIDQSLVLVQKIGRLNQSLRNLLMTQKSANEPVSIGACMEEMLPILQNEARRRSVQFNASTQPLALNVLAHKVLLERIMLNLVANALDALTGDGAAAKNSPQTPKSQPQITLLLEQQTRHGHPHAVLTVEDNGPGFEAHLLAQEWVHFQSTKTSGMGVGLLLCHYILSTWSGEMVLQNRPTGGASVRLWIPLQSA
jgi:signal transduction histidine kinase